MNNYFSKNLILLLFALYLIACARENKDPSIPVALPSATQTGANTFGCLVNGVLFGANGKEPSFTSTPNPRCEITDVISINADQFGSGWSHLAKINLYIGRNAGIGIYPIDNSTSAGNATSYIKYPTDSCTYFNFTDPHSSTLGEIHITKINSTGQENRMVSGTFWLNIFKQGCGDTIRIQQGRFDVRM